MTTITPICFDVKAVTESYESKQNVVDSHLAKLLDIVVRSGGEFEGNIFYHNATTVLNPDMKTKQLNIYWCGMNAPRKICEIGFNAGHSAMTLLLGRDGVTTDFTIFDINYHPYTIPTYKYIKKVFFSCQY